MKHEVFEQILSSRLESIKATLAKKSQEYSSNEDRLHNFKRAAEIERISVRRAWLGMFTKHMVSVIDIVESGFSTPGAVVDEKVGGSINYLILLEAILKETYIIDVGPVVESKPKKR
jgi:molecular chaperone GrpE (heat shock protein)